MKLDKKLNFELDDSIYVLFERVFSIKNKGKKDKLKFALMNIGFINNMDCVTHKLFVYGSCNRYLDRCFNRKSTFRELLGYIYPCNSDDVELSTIIIKVVV